MINCGKIQMERRSRSHVAPMRKSVWMLSWSLLESMGSGARESCGGFSMPWAVSGTMQGCFWPLMRRTLDVSSRVRLSSGGWTGTGCWKRVRTSLIMFWLWLWRTSLNVACRQLCSRLVWQSPSIMPVCLSGRGISGKFICSFACNVDQESLLMHACFPCKARNKWKY